MHQKDVPKLFKSTRKEVSKMALLATPINSIFCVDQNDAAVLQKKSTAVLDALQKIRTAEAKNHNKDRLQELDEKIKRLQREADK